MACAQCGRKYDHNEAHQLCGCGKPLLVEYDLERVAAHLTKDGLRAMAPTLWRYASLLPVQHVENIVSLGEGVTPLLRVDRAGRAAGLANLWLKDDSMLPTGTFKARGAAVGVSRAKELGARTLIMPTNGNAGAAWAAYGARAGLKSVFVMPQDSPVINKKECAVAGAELYLVDGLISDADKIVNRAVQRYHWTDVSTFKEPYRTEGKKTTGLEIAEQLNWQAPDVIIYPTGGCIGPVGVYKAFRELREMGWISGAMPRLVAVQAAGCAPIVKAWNEGKRESAFWDGSETCAFGINVPKALGDFMVLEAMRATQGCAIDVTDEEILQARDELAALEGTFICPEGAATYAAAKKLRDRGWLAENEKVVLVNTGAGLKYPDTVQVKAPVLGPDEEIGGREDNE